MHKVVIDTNVFVSALISKKGVPFQLVNKWKDGYFILITAKTLINELQETLSQPRFQKKYPTIGQDLADLTALFEMDALMIEPYSDLRGSVPSDPDDEIFLAAAVDGQADAVISGDADLLSLKVFRDIPIITPREFLEII